MAKSAEKPGKNKEGVAERSARYFRNLNALGAIAFAGAAIVAPPAAVVLNAFAAVDAAQAGGFELARRWAKKRRVNKKS